MRPMTEMEATAAKHAILKLADSAVWGYTYALLGERLAMDMLNARDVIERESVASEHRLMEKFFNSLNEIANQVRGI